MTVGVASKIQREIDDTLYYNFDVMKQVGKQKKQDFQVEFRHVQLILLGYLCALVFCLLILVCEQIYFIRMQRNIVVMPYLP